MPSTGIVRRFWWRINQRARLAVACLGILTALVTTGTVGFGGEVVPQERESAGLEEAMHRGDSLEVTVHTVSDVDLFEGVEPATGLAFRARVAGLRQIADCGPAESRSVAQSLLRGKNVWLVVKSDDVSGNDRIAVDVRLPDGADYARTIVHEGAASADLSAREELAPVESAARQEHRGLWAAGCAPDAATATATSAPSSSAPSPTVTTTTTTTTTTESSAPPPSSEPATATSRPPADDAWVRFVVGKRCFFEGVRKRSPKGNVVVCGRNGKNQLRWRRAD
ncbi:hypothetical protein FKR81_27860 [Lentzea tibetensis]|uniref:TNase-like domain-containing protein n=1 Tax=Lentzea tibetensis TaxID=2591470 RepID=A0A563EMJ8_9PSEU|nr:hypothetical protein [Lentzea tibetensis]TWP48416.1 hypothetical protein FKR81_27860 [Lentzea tibetensis]